MNPQNPSREIAALDERATRAAQSGNEQEALALWAQILAIDPNNTRTLTAIGHHSFRKGDLQSARAALQRVVDAHGDDPQQWINLAHVCQRLNDEAGEEAAITGALTADASDLMALLMRGKLFERRGMTRNAAAAYSAAVQVSPPLDRLLPELRPGVQHAIEFRDKHNAVYADFLDRYLDPFYKAHGGERLNRFRDSVDIMTGHKKRFDSQSMIQHFPGLPTIEFFDRASFPWLDAFDAAADDVRREFIGVLEAEEGFTPYITYANDMPLNQWAELNNSPSWSAFHLIKDGKRVEENAAKCPTTMKLLAGAPQPDQPGRTPSAMFSLLKPKTRIPPHVGVSNVRLVCHLPLIIPAGCRFRVGNDVREWVPGKAWVFDDTIEHEAWNDSDKPRAVLIFDIWNPYLTEAERAMVTALSGAINAFSGGGSEFGL
jgi:aspartate beta-hydroxylase